MSHEIFRYRQEFRPGVIALLRHLVSPLPELNDAYFRWKHEDNPYLREPHVYVAVAGGKVAGIRAFQGARWKTGAGDAEVFWPCACDFVVDPAHRGRKLFRQIMNFALADLAGHGIGPILNWSASPVTFGASLRSGWRLVGPYVLWGRQTPRARRARRLSARMRRLPLAWRIAELPSALAWQRGFDALDSAWSRSTNAAQISLAKEPRPEAMAHLAGGASAPRVRHVSDAGYFRWRFGNPLSDYRFVFCGESALRGYLVLQVSRRDNAADISIVDWAVSQPSDLAILLARVVELGGYDSLSMWTATLDADTKALLQELGFEFVDQTRGDPGYRPGLLVVDARQPEAGAADETDVGTFGSFDGWDLRMMYSDLY